MSRKLFRTTEQLTIELSSAPIRPLKDDFVRISPKAVAVNPTDWKHVKLKLAVGSGSGCDFAGIITEVGSAVQGYKVGDQVAGGQPGASNFDKDDGAYSEFIDLQADSLYKLPLELSTDSRDVIPSGKIRTFEQAASLGIAVGTVAIAVADYKKDLFVKNSAKGWALVYGAGGSLGFITAQAFKWLGYDVIAVASEKHRSNLKAAGIEYLVDYHDKDWPQKAKEIAGDRIIYAYDTISENGTTNQVYEAVSSKAHIHLSLPVENLPTSKDVTIDIPLWYYFWSKTWSYTAFPAGCEEFIESRPVVFEQINKLLAEDILYCLPVRVLDGFERTPEAIEYAAAGKVQGEKLVVRY